MIFDVVRFFSLLFAILALMPAAAHLMELPNKIHLSPADYLTVQKIYRGWALAGIVVIAALLSSAILAFLVRNLPTTFKLTLLAVICIIGTQIVFGF